MKIFKAALLVLFVSLMASCSSDDGTPVNNVPSGPEATYFNYKLDGETIPMVANGFISGDGIRVEATATDGRGFAITFTTHGQIAQAMATSSQNPFEPRLNYQKFRKNYFDLDLIWVANGQAKVNFAGKLYADGYNLESEFSTVEGSFVVNLIDLGATGSSFEMDATLNGSNWHAMGGNDNFFATNYSVDYTSDDEYEISLVFHPGNIEVGDYIFTETAGANRIRVTKYNTTTHNDDELISTMGNFKVTSKTAFGSLKTIVGTFDVIAHHPETNETVTITNGTFKATYQY